MSEEKLYPQCPFCRKVRTIEKRGSLYVCGVCHRVMKKFGYASMTAKGKVKKK